MDDFTKILIRCNVFMFFLHKKQESRNSPDHEFQANKWAPSVIMAPLTM